MSSEASEVLNESAILGDTSSLAVDPMGYLIRTTFDEDDPTRPQYQLKPQDRSLLSTAGQVLGMEDEGFLSLWKGSSRREYLTESGRSGSLVSLLYQGNSPIGRMKCSLF